MASSNVTSNTKVHSESAFYIHLCTNMSNITARASYTATYCWTCWTKDIIFQCSSYQIRDSLLHKSRPLEDVRGIKTDDRSKIQSCPSK